MSGLISSILAYLSRVFWVQRLTGLVAIMLAVSGCVSSPTDALNVSGALPPPPVEAQALPSATTTATTTATGEPITGAKKTGTFPNFGTPPQGQTTQMTESERADIRSTLAPGQNRTSEAEAKAAEAAYLREVENMRGLAEQQRRKIAAQNF